MIKIMSWKSCAQWPEGTLAGNKNDQSADNHTNRSGAESVCRLLNTEGFGGERKIFPVATWVIPSFQRTEYFFSQTFGKHIEINKSEGHPPTD